MRPFLSPNSSRRRPASGLLAAAPWLVLPALASACRSDASPEAPAAAPAPKPPAAIEELERKLKPPAATSPALSDRAAPPVPEAKRPADSELPAPAARRPAPPKQVSGEGTDLEESQLLEAAERFARALVEGLRAGDEAGLARLVMADPEAKDLLTEGIYSVMGRTVVPQTQRHLRHLAEQVRGKKLGYKLKPGRLSSTAGRAAQYRKIVPMMSNAVLELDADGTAILVELVQLYWSGGGWKIFQLRL